MKKSKHRIIVLLALAFLFGGEPAFTQTEIKLIPSDSDTAHQFGYDVAISGNQIIASAPGNPKTYIYENISGWTETFSYVRNESLCNWSNSQEHCITLGTNCKKVDIKGDFAITGGRGFEHYNHNPLQFTGSSYHAVMFRKINGVWGEYYTHSTPFHVDEVTSVGINDSTGIIGCEDYNLGNGGIWVFPPDWGNGYTPGNNSEYLGTSIATSGQFTVVGGINSVRVLTTLDVITSPLGSSNFGHSVAVQGDSIIVVGQPSAGKVYVYKWNGSWDLLTTFESKEDLNYYYGFGKDVAISNSIVAVGAPAQNNNTGAVYLFSLVPDSDYGIINTSHFKIITASDAWEGMNFGEDLDIYDQTLVVGVKNDSTNGPNSGAVYIYNCFMGATASIVKIPDHGASTGSIELRAYGGIDPYQYDWNTGQTSRDISGLASGTYSVTVTDQYACAVNRVIDLPYNPRLQSAEYFFDTDPGVGNGTSFGQNSINYNMDTTYTVSVSGLSPGFHHLYIRHLNEDRNWGITEGRAFYVFPDAILNPSGPINAMEYFFDTDPGIGNGNAITLTPADTINNVFDVNTAGLETGFHNIYFRFKDSNGTWGIYEGGEFELKNALVVSAFLEGAYNGTDMDNSLDDVIPLSQPYNTAPWNYNGTETVTSIPANTVDWVLVEYRETPFVADSAKSGTILGRKAGFLLRDGSIVDIDGSSNFLFEENINDNLYVVLWHRNHIGIMSAFPLTLIDGKYAYDFSTGAAQVHGGISGHVHLGGGVYGMAAGDGDADGNIGLPDIDGVWKPQSGTTGYLMGDFSLDSQVNNIDKNDLWLPNNSLGSQVPE